MLGNNIQYLRKQRKITQEDFAQTMMVSRQTVSKWESGDVTPELNKLIEICNYFSCSLDDLVRKNIEKETGIYSKVSIETIKPFRMARYVIISPQPENDVNAYMDRWAQDSGLLEYDPNAQKIGWDFSCVSSEQKNRFGLRGYVTAYILPDGFDPAYPGVEITGQKEAQYALITIKEPLKAPFERIPNACKMILEYLGASGFKEKPDPDILAYFEKVYEKEGTVYMDLYVHIDAVAKGNLHTDFS